MRCITVISIKILMILVGEGNVKFSPPLYDPDHNIIIENNDVISSELQTCFLIEQK